MRRHRTTSRKPAKARGQKAAKPKRFNLPSAASSEKLSVAELQEQVSTLTNELRQRTAELTESLEQQTATSEVLQVISSSAGDLESVFARILENGVRICDANFGNIYRWDGEVLHVVAMHNTPPAFAELRRRTPYRPNSGHIGRMVTTKSVVHIVDAAIGGLIPKAFRRPLQPSNSEAYGRLCLYQCLRRTN